MSDPRFVSANPIYPEVVKSDIETVREALADYYSDWTELTDPASITALDRLSTELERLRTREKDLEYVLADVREDNGILTRRLARLRAIESAVREYRETDAAWFLAANAHPYDARAAADANIRRRDAADILFALLSPKGEPT